MSLQAIELNSDNGQRSGHGNFQFCAKRLRYSCRVALCAFFRLCEVPRCGGDHRNSLSSTAAATSPSSTAAWRCLTTPDCAPHSDVRVDSAGTRAIGTTVRSHPQLLNGRLRSTTASCGTTPASCHQDAPPNASCLDSILLRGFAPRHDAAALQKPGHFGLHIFESTWVGFRGSWRWPFT